MKKKYINIFLIILLIFIWGSVIIKFFSKEEVVESPNFYVLDTDNYHITARKDSFSIRTINKDPFGISKKKWAQNKVKAATTIKQPQAINRKITQATKNDIWPKIEYFGFVKNKTNTTKLALVKINSRLYRKREKEYIDDYLLVKAYGDSIIMSKNKIKKTIKRAND